MLIAALLIELLQLYNFIRFYTKNSHKFTILDILFFQLHYSYIMAFGRTNKIIMEQRLKGTFSLIMADTIKMEVEFKNVFLEVANVLLGKN